MKNIQWASTFAILPLLLAGTARAEDHAGNPLLDHVRAANSRFADVAVAVAEGYSPIPCVSSAEHGGMGVHYVSADHLKNDAIDLQHAEAIMYEPMPGGGMQLIGVEYITYKGPTALEGHLFNYYGAPNRYGLNPYYELHVWAWKPNPSGAFADMNPDVSCDHMAAH